MAIIFSQTLQSSASLEKLANLFERKMIKNPDALVVRILWSPGDKNIESSGSAIGIGECGLDYDESDVEG